MIFVCSNSLRSGPGSSTYATANTRRIIITVLQLYNLTSMLDIPCGDITWMPEVWKQYRQFQYIGADIVPQLVAENRVKFPEQQFMILDMVEGVLPEVDLIFCRDALQHLQVHS